MTERDFQRRFTRWCKYNINKTSVFELKFCKDKSLPFSAVKEHQIEGLAAAKKKMVYKIPDLGMQNPFDCLCVTGAEAYIVIMFYKRGQKKFYMIELEDFLHMKGIFNRKSITEDMAKQYGRSCYLK